MVRATTEVIPLSLLDALPLSPSRKNHPALQRPLEAAQYDRRGAAYEHRRRRRLSERQFARGGGRRWRGADPGVDRAGNGQCVFEGAVAGRRIEGQLHREALTMEDNDVLVE